MVKRIGGLSLIELMVTLVVATIIALYGGSLTARWLGKQKLHAAVEMMQQGYARARAEALSNGASSNGVASILVLANKQLCVQPSDYTALDCQEPNWLADLAVDSATIAQANTQCIVFNSSGLPTAGIVAGANCVTSTQYSLSKGSDNVDGYLE